MKKFLQRVMLTILASFSTIIMAGSFTVCGKNSIKYGGVPHDDIAKNMAIAVTINDQLQPERNMTFDQNSSCTDYTFTGLKANVKLREKFPGADYYFDWINVFPLREVNDKMIIYICQGLFLDEMVDPIAVGVTYAAQWGNATFSKSEWNSWDYKCGKIKPDQYWSGII